MFDKPKIILLIQSKNGNVFGEYTNVGWNSTAHHFTHTADKDAFVFQKRFSRGYNPFISNVKQDEDSINMALGCHDLA